MSYGIYIDSKTGDYTLQNGEIVNKNALLTRAYMYLSCVKGTCIYDPTIGIDLPINSKANLTKNQFIQAIQKALQPLVADGSVTTMLVEILSAIAGKYIAQITLVDHNRQPLTFTWSSIIT